MSGYWSWVAPRTKTLEAAKSSHRKESMIAEGRRRRISFKTVCLSLVPCAKKKRRGRKVKEKKTEVVKKYYFGADREERFFCHECTQPRCPAHCTHLIHPSSGTGLGISKNPALDLRICPSSAPNPSEARLKLRSCGHWPSKSFSCSITNHYLGASFPASDGELKICRWEFHQIQMLAIGPDNLGELNFLAVKIWEETRNTDG